MTDNYGKVSDNGPPRRTAQHRATSDVHLLLNVWISAHRRFNLGDQRSRGFLFGATAGRATLSGEGLPDQDGSTI